MSTDDDFYEEDEPVQKIIDAFNRGDKRLTRPALPNRGFNETLFRPTPERWTATVGDCTPVVLDLGGAA